MERQPFSVYCRHLDIIIKEEFTVVQADWEEEQTCAAITKMSRIDKCNELYNKAMVEQFCYSDARYLKFAQERKEVKC